VQLSPDTVPLDRLDTLWDFDDPAESERRFEAVVSRARAERQGAFLAEALTQLARAQGLQRHFEAARRTLADAERALAPDDRRGRVRLLLERGRVERFERRDGLGRSAFLDAWELARASTEDGLAVDAAHMLGIVEPAEEGWEWNERAMELARRSPDPAARRWVGSLANNMGWARHEAGDDDGAIALFELARDEWLADGRVERARIARWSIARCMRSRGDVDAALAEQLALLAELDGLRDTDGYVFEELGECLLALGRDDEARPFFVRAYAELADDLRLETRHAERLARLRSLAGVEPQTDP
jgi:tetratricopeptide (TPR) repeat protein